jgi:hypothetical protein
VDFFPAALKMKSASLCRRLQFAHTKVLEKPSANAAVTTGLCAGEIKREAAFRTISKSLQ